MSCPDNLLTGYRRGALSSEEQSRLNAHLDRCPTCRLTLRVGEDFDEALQTLPGDDLIAARFARNLGPKFVREQTRSRAGAWRYAWVAAASIAIVASAGLAAARLGAWPFAVRKHAEESSPGGGLRKSKVRSSPEPQATPVAMPAVQTAPETPLPAPAADPVAVRSSPRAASAGELFTQANTKRRDADLVRARHLYRELQQRYPRSAETEVSRVSLGRVELELGRAREAFEQFASYLASRPRGPLAEEAMFGKASALSRLHRRGEERRTWEALLSTFPGSIYADRARHRLEVLRGDEPVRVPPLP